MTTVVEIAGPDDPELDTLHVPLREVLRLIAEATAKRDEEIGALHRIVAEQALHIATLDVGGCDFPAPSAPRLQ